MNGLRHKLIVPLQRGELPAAEMLATVKAILGTDRFAAGIPSCVNASLIKDCATPGTHAFDIFSRAHYDAAQVGRAAAFLTLQHGADITPDAGWLRSRLELVCQMWDQICEPRVGTKTTIATHHARTTAIVDPVAIGARWDCSKAEALPLPSQMDTTNAASAFGNGTLSTSA